MTMSYDEAAAALNDPNLDPAVLAQIAHEHEELRTQAALHSMAYPGLLDWLDAFGDAPTKMAVKLNRKRLNVDS